MNKEHSTKNNQSTTEEGNVFFSRAAKYLVSPDAEASDLYDDATLFLSLVPDLISKVQEGLHDHNGKLTVDPRLESMLAGIEYLCEQAQGSLSAISFEDLSSAKGKKPN